MIHLKIFQTKEAFEEKKSELVKPWVVLTKDNGVAHFMDDDEPEEDLSEIIRMINGNEEGVSTTYTSVEEIINLING